MNQTQFEAFCAKGPVLLDGATGTNLQQAGLPAGSCPEQWVLNHPDVLTALQASYLRAGSSILYTFTLGANRIKLADHGISDDLCMDINRRLAMISVAVRDRWTDLQNATPDGNRETPDRTILIAGDLAPTGLFLAPAGDLSFESLVSIYRQQVLGLIEAGVDLFVVETMIDLAQARAAVLAIQSVCDLPIMVSLTFEKNGRTLTGNPPLECLLALASMGVAAFGINCSFGPDKLADLLSPLLPISPIPLLVKPNAGMPHLVDGKTVFPMDAVSFANAMQPMMAAGVALLGGCCGTSPEHVSALSRITSTGITSPSITSSRRGSAWIDEDCDHSNLDAWKTMICSSRQSWNVGSLSQLPVLNCREADDLEDLPDLLDRHPDAAIIDLTDCPANSQLEQLQDAIEQVQLLTSVPLIFRDHDQQRLKSLLRHYHGRAGILVSGPADHQDPSGLVFENQSHGPVLINNQESLSS